MSKSPQSPGELSEAVDAYLVGKFKSRKGAQGRYRYLVSWQGYGSEEDTWETREDLLNDGFDKEVEEYDAQLAEKRTRKPAATPQRRRSTVRTPASRRTTAETPRTRSRTPAKKVPPPKEDSSSSEGESEDEKESHRHRAVRKVASDQLQISDSEIQRRTIEARSWLPLFLSVTTLCLLFHIVEPIARNHGKVAESVFHTAGFFVDFFPMLICVYAIARNSRTDYSNFAMASCMWMALFKFCDYPLNACDFLFRLLVCKLFGWCKSSSEPLPDLYFCFLSWSICALWMVSWKYALPRGRTPSNLESLAGYAVCFGLVIYHAMTCPNPLASSQYLLVFIVFCVGSNAKMRGLVSSVHSKKFHILHWTEAVFFVCGCLYILLALVELNTEYRGIFREIFDQFASLDDITISLTPVGLGHIGYLKLPIFRIFRDFLVWYSVAGVAFLSIVYYG